MEFVMQRMERTERNITKLVLEDPSGSIEGIIFDEELQKTAGILLIDQFVMARVASTKNSGFMIKDLIYCRYISIVNF